MSESTAPPAPTSVEAAWKVRRTVDPAQLDDARLGHYRHPSEWQALLTIAAVFVAVDLALIMIGPDARESLRSQLHWLPHGLAGAIMNVVHLPGGVTSTVLGLLLATMVVDLYSHWLQRAEVLSESIEISATTLPQLYPLVEELRERFALPSTRVFVSRAAAKPYSLGIWRAYFIVLPVAWLGLLTQDELRFVLGHEMGHIKLGHTRLEPFLGGGDWSSQGALAVLDQLRGLIMSSYQQAQELSGDRIGVLACRSVGPAVSASLKAGVGAPRGARLDIEALAPQASEVHRGTMALASRLRLIGRPQPPLIYRLKELVVWAGLPTEAAVPAPPAQAAAAEPAAGQAQSPSAVGPSLPPTV